MTFVLEFDGASQRGYSGSSWHERCSCLLARRFEGPLAGTLERVSVERVSPYEMIDDPGVSRRSGGHVLRRADYNRRPAYETYLSFTAEHCAP